MLKRKLLGDLKWIYPLDPAVDLELWETEGNPKDYFNTDFTLPPIKKGEKATVFTIKQLSGEQLNTAVNLLNQNLENDFIEFVIRRGLVDWTDLYYEKDNSEIEELKPEFERDTNNDKILSKGVYYKLFPFLIDFTEMISLTIYKVSHL